jgi:putative DNA primase/helicase
MDLDHVIREGKILPWAQSAIDTLKGAYIERSSSGDGYHIFTLGKKQHDAKVKSNPSGIPNQGDKFEIYDENKVIRLTSNQIDQSNNCLIDLTPEISVVYFSMFSENVQEELKAYKPSPPLKDEEIISKLKRATNAPKFNMLFDEGDLSKYGNDPSSAEKALCDLLVFYTQDHKQIDRLIRESKLFETVKKIRKEKSTPENKWEDREDYRTQTINKALSKLTATWQPKQTDTDNFTDETKSTWENPEGLDDIESSNRL